MTIHITIPGRPIAKARPRFFRRGAFVGTYNPQETEEGRWQVSATVQLQAQDPDYRSNRPIRLECLFYMPIPESWSKKRKEDLGGLLAGFGKGHTTKPDLNNLIKWVEDCLNGIAWKDDSQVYQITAEKRYDTEPRTEVYIHED